MRRGGDEEEKTKLAERVVGDIHAWLSCRAVFLLVHASSYPVPAASSRRDRECFKDDQEEENSFGSFSGFPFLGSKGAEKYAHGGV